MNIGTYLAIILISLFVILVTKKTLGIRGLYMLFIVFSQLSLILSFKYITIGNININSNVVTLVNMYTMLYLIVEEKGKKDARKIIKTNFFLLTFSSIICYIYTLHNGVITDTMHVNINNVFKSNFLILIYFPVVSFIINLFIIYIYPIIRKLYDVPFITTVSTYLPVGLIETILFTLPVYYNKLSLKLIIELILSNYMIGLIITIIYSFFLIILCKKKVIK